MRINYEIINNVLNYTLYPFDVSKPFIEITNVEFKNCLVDKQIDIILLKNMISSKL
jgi:hypothetical protein